MHKMWTVLLAALALTGCAAAPADELPATESTAETAETTAAETEEAAARPVGFAVGNLTEVPNTCGGYWGWNTGDAYYEIARLYEENDPNSMHALLLKTDYATAQQTVLCNVPGCTHDSAACPAWLEDWARTDLLVMPSGIYLSYAGLDDVYSWEQVEKESRDFYEQGYATNFTDEEAYIAYCRHNYELDCRPSTIERLNDDLTARETVLTYDPSLLGGGYFAYCDENALYAKDYSDANNIRILRLDLATGEWSTLPLNLGEQVRGVNGHRFLTSRLLTDAPLPDKSDYEAYDAALQNARSELIWLDPETLQREKICETERLDGNTIYVKIYKDRVYVQDNPQNRSEYGTSYSLSYYSKDRQHTVVIDTLPMNLYLPSTDNGFMPVFGSEERSWIWAQDYNGSTDVNYLIDLDTGEMHTMTQTQYRDGMATGVSLMAQTNDGRWMIGYKPHSERHNDRCDYGFIDPQEFWNGSENYTPVQMWD